jgi:hypothetical protein
VQSKAQLLEMFAAGKPIGRIADFLNGRKQQADENCDDAKNNQELDQRKGGSSTVHDVPPTGR